MHPCRLSCKLTLKTFKKHYLKKYFTVFQPRLKRKTSHLRFRVENQPETSQVRAHHAAPRGGLQPGLGSRSPRVAKGQTDGGSLGACLQLQLHLGGWQSLASSSSSRWGWVSLNLARGRTVSQSRKHALMESRCTEQTSESNERRAEVLAMEMPWGSSDNTVGTAEAFVPFWSHW